MAQDSKKIATQEKPQEQQPIIHTGQMQVIYADRILNVGFGPVVSKLTLGLEVGPNTFSSFANIVIPTLALIEAVEFLQKATSENDEMTSVIIDGVDKIKALLEKRKK